MQIRLTSSGKSSQEPKHWTFSTKFKQTYKERTSHLKNSVIEESSCQCSMKRKDNEDSCALTSRKIREYASNFNDGHCAFLGPGEESKWYLGYATDYGGKWDLRASQMVEHFENSGHPVFHGVSPLGRGTLKKKNNRDTITIQWRICQYWLAVQNCSCREPALCPRGSPNVVWTEFRRSKPKADPTVLARCHQKFKNSEISSHWLVFQDYRMHLETECFRLWTISIRCHLWAKLNISVQRRTSTIRSRKETTMLQLLSMMTDGESALRCAKNIQRPETERIQSHTHRLMQTNNLVQSWILRCLQSLTFLVLKCKYHHWVHQDTPYGFW